MEDSRSEELTNEDLSLFKEALTASGSDQIEVKLSTIKCIGSLAKVLGPQRTIDELLQFINNQLDSFEDEVLCCLVEELEHFMPLVGGSKHCHELIAILLKISRSVDETLVRDKAVEAIKKLLEDIDERVTENLLVATLVGNADNIWFSEKCSTLSLIPICYPKASAENKALLRQKYCQIFEDTSAMIRKLAAMSLQDFIEVIEIEHVLKEFVPVLNMIVQDDQEIVRLNAVDVALSIASKSKNQEVRNNMFEVIKDQFGDSWKSRQKIAITINNISDVFSEEEFLDTLFKMYESLVKDRETEVKIEAVLNLYKFAESLHDNIKKMENPKNTFDELFINKLMPIIAHISNDSSVHLPFSSVILSLGVLISNEVFKDTLLNIVVVALEHAYPPEFKENILMNLKFLPKDIDLSKSLSSIRSVVKSILETSITSWRTRRSTLISFVNVARFCTAEYFQDNLLVYYILLLKDNIYAVRRAASLILPILMKRYGVRWLTRELMPLILDIPKSKKYLMRYVILFCIEELIFPTIEKNKMNPGEEIYTKGLQKLVEEKEEKFGRLLCRISSLNQKLKESLYQEPFKSIIDNYTDEYNIGSEDIQIYTEEMLDSIPITEKGMFNLDIEDGQDDICYLEGVLVLLNKILLEILRSLLEDPVKNIRDRTGYVLTRIKKFCKDLDVEMSVTWISDYTSTVENSVWKEIDIQINDEIDKSVIECKTDEKIDTTSKTSICEDPPSEETIDSKIDEPEIEVFPSGITHTEEIPFEQMKSLDEEKGEDSNC